MTYSTSLFDCQVHFFGDTDMMIPFPRLPETDGNKCTESGCDGFYQPYSDGSFSCYQGHVSSVSMDDVEIEGWVLVSGRGEC